MLIEELLIFFLLLPAVLGSRSMDPLEVEQLRKLLHQLEDCDDVGEVHHNAVFDPDPWS